MNTALLVDNESHKTRDGSLKEDNAGISLKPTWTMKDVREAIPPHLHVQNTWKGLSYYFRDWILVATLWVLAMFIDDGVEHLHVRYGLGDHVAGGVWWLLWVAYWGMQGLSFTALWMIGHECGHGGIAESRVLCDVLGYVAHSTLLTPYFSWKISHHRHHIYNGSFERDEIFVPKARGKTFIAHSDSAMDDAPFYTLATLVVQQLIGLPCYLLFNVGGQPHYPKTTSHYNPYSIMFRPSQRRAIFLSDIGVLTALYILYHASSSLHLPLFKLYFIPWLLMNHWVVMLTYLQHTDPSVPFYRAPAWSFTKGTVATVDRDFFGWVGRFFFHDISHYHVVHHMFPSMPFYNGEEATNYLKACIGDEYKWSGKPAFRALWDNFNECWYVDDEGDVVYYRNKRGELARRNVGETTGEEEHRIATSEKT